MKLVHVRGGWSLGKRGIVAHGIITGARYESRWMPGWLDLCRRGRLVLRVRLPWPL